MVRFDLNWPRKIGALLSGEPRNKNRCPNDPRIKAGGGKARSLAGAGWPGAVR